MRKWLPNDYIRIVETKDLNLPASNSHLFWQ